MTQNPFTLTTILPPDPLCDRREELARLLSWARAGQNATLIAARRMGKTSLVLRAQHELRAQGFLTIFVDFYRVASLEEMARRLAGAVYGAVQAREGILERAAKLAAGFRHFRPVMRLGQDGMPELSVEAAGPGPGGLALLDETLSDLGRLVAKAENRVQVTLDEFQEITQLGEPGVEGVLRSHIQMQKASFFFVGSRRRILREMFEDESRPFYQSAFTLALGSLAGEEARQYLMDRTAAGGKRCPPGAAGKLAGLAQGSPFYLQKLAFFAFDQAGEEMGEEDVDRAFRLMLMDQEPFFNAVLDSLSTGQLRAFRALAGAGETASPYGAAFLREAGLSQSTMQRALAALVDRDLVERRGREGPFRLVDPLLGHWLRQGLEFRPGPPAGGMKTA